MSGNCIDSRLGWGLILWLFMGLGAAQAQDAILAQVAYVGDGDTIWVDSWLEKHGPRQRVRIVGIDAPEICQAQGVQARDALRSRIGGKTVRLVFAQVEAERKDVYGRWLAQVVLQPGAANPNTSTDSASHGVDGVADIGEWMVASGYAWSSSYRGRTGSYQKNQVQARKSAYGIWQKSAQPTLSPWRFRRIHGSCYVEKSPAQ